MKNLQYNWNNITNLISSIRWYVQANQTYDELEYLKTTDLEKYDNVILFLVDWLWYNWLESYWKNSFLYSRLKWQINSVFPSTTSSTITTINTWFAPSDHWVVWWNMYSKEVWWLVKILPWLNKISESNIWENVEMKNIVSKQAFYPHSKKDVFIVTSNVFKNSKYNLFYNDKTKVLWYSDLSECFAKTIWTINFNKKQKYTYTYWPDFDRKCHDYWIDSPEVMNHFEDLDYHFEKLEKIAKETNTLVIVTADHGQLNCDKIIDIRNYKELEEMLLLPLSWEPRCQYCFVKKWFEEDFYNQVKEKFSDMADIYTRDEVLESKIFWNWQDEKFLYRIWDFLILPKEWYLLTDWTDWIHIWNHWGISDWETKIPLIYF